MSNVQDSNGGLKEDVQQTQTKLSLRIKLIVRPPPEQANESTTTAHRDSQLRRSSRSRLKTRKAKEQDIEVRKDKMYPNRRKTTQKGGRQLESKKISTSISATGSKVNNMHEAFEERSTDPSGTDRPIDTTLSPTPSAVAPPLSTSQKPEPYANFGSAPQATMLDLLAIAAGISQDEVTSNVTRDENVYITAQTDYFTTKVRESENHSKLNLVNNGTTTYSGNPSNQSLSTYIDINESRRYLVADAKAPSVRGSASGTSQAGKRQNSARQPSVAGNC